MKITVNTYIPGESPIHRCDARVKIILLVAYTVTLFLVDTWKGLLLCTVAFVAVLVASRIPARRIFGLLTPLYVIAGIVIVVNGFVFDAGGAPPVDVASGLGDVSPGALAAMPPFPLMGSLWFVPSGFARGCFYAVRIVLLVAASLVVSYTTTSTKLTDAFGDFLRPLRVLRVPSDDVAMVFSLALRFIPVTAEELIRIHDAQWARGAAFSEGSLWKRLRAWQTVLIPLFVGLFRRADVLAVAMDARCYGAPGVTRTSLAERGLTGQSAIVLSTGVASLVLVAVFL